MVDAENGTGPGGVRLIFVEHPSREVQRIDYDLEQYLFT